MHLDMDAFFAAVEQRDNPQLKGKPVIIYHPPESRSVVSTASYEARALGVRSGMPLFLARQKCPRGIFIPGNHRKYAAISAEIMAICQKYTPLVERFSIDEAFLDVTGCQLLFGPPLEMAQKIKDEIRSRLGLTCSVGIGPNKLLAKMASDLQKPDGLFIITAADAQAVLAPLPVGKLYLVGPQTEKRLLEMGITTIGALAQIPPAILQQRFGLLGLTLSRFARGEDDTPVIAADRSPSSIGHERTLLYDTGQRKEILGHLLELVEMVCHRMRREGYKGRQVTLKLRDTTFRIITRSHTLSLYTDDEREVYPLLQKLLDRHWEGWKVRLVGVSISQLKPITEIGEQLTLFTPPQRRELLLAVDQLRERFGHHIIMRASLCSLKKKRSAFPG